MPFIFVIFEGGGEVTCDVCTEPVYLYEFVLVCSYWRLIMVKLLFEVNGEVPCGLRTEVTCDLYTKPVYLY